ncbi:39S ribosomal protein L18, mitochondrial [Dirofilaria immitis]|nr:39S ribosomal protein L18, mitochondrial [Dirofilaria immitis]
MALEEIEMTRLRLLTKFVNRNPRNIEQLGLQPYPVGYGLNIDRQKYSFIYRANFERHRRYVEGYIEHYKEGTILTASSREKQISAQLFNRLLEDVNYGLKFFSLSDVSACASIGRILGLRCAMAGIHFLQAIDMKDIERSAHVNICIFGALTESGVKFGEPQPTPHTFEVDPELTYDRYEIQHTREDNIE